ncbi:creatininase family protein [Microbacteriaceae bacterium 4G12]
MTYSIFQETMADMTWTEVEESIRNGAIVLLPSGVIEQQGPHICTGADIYISHLICKYMKRELEENGIHILIAPPFYWGINHVTGAFPGSFTARKDIVKALLFDILDCLQKWGVQQVFLIDVHGDYQHGSALFESIKEARAELHIDVKLVISHWIANQLLISKTDPHYLIFEVPIQLPEEKPKYFDIHAGEESTARMLKHFSSLVDINIAKTLEPTNFAEKEFKEWQKGGEKVRQLTPSGYFGNPANFASVDPELDFVQIFSKYAAEKITAYMK